MKNVLLALTLFTVLFIAACAKKTTPASSAAETPKVKATTYTADVVPLIQMRCTPCHFPSKGGNKASFETYESAKKYGADILARVQLNPGDRGFMPFKHPKLSADEIAVLKKWLDDGLVEK